MATPKLPLRQRFNQMYTQSLDDWAPDGSFHFGLNLLATVDGRMVQRPPMVRFGSTTVTGNIRAVGSIFVAGTGYVRFVVTDTPAIYTMNLSAGTYSLDVTSANFTSAGVVPGTIHSESVGYNGTAVFVDLSGTNKPWTYNGGSGASAVAHLTNAPLTILPPTVHAGKLFFIKKTDPRVILWSEENAANTGYDQGGYTNTWTLSQTTDRPVTTLLGSNIGLYFWRHNSASLITGSVTPDFATSATLDNAGAIGCAGATSAFAGPAAAILNNVIWFAANNGDLCALPVGAAEAETIFSFNDLVNYTTTATTGDETLEPFETTTASASSTNFRGVIALPDGLPKVIRDPVIIATTTAKEHLVVNARTRKPIGWLQTNTDSGALVLAIGKIYDSTANKSYLVCRDSLATTRLWCWGFNGNAPVTDGTDQDTAGAAVSQVFKVISGPLGGGEKDWVFNRVYYGISGRTQTLTVSHQYLTSTYNHASLMPSAQTQSAVFASGYRSQVQLVYGTDGSFGRWMRSVLSITTATACALSIDKLAVDGYPQGTAGAA